MRCPIRSILLDTRSRVSTDSGEASIISAFNTSSLRLICSSERKRKGGNHGGGEQRDQERGAGVGNGLQQGGAEHFKQEAGTDADVNRREGLGVQVERQRQVIDARLAKDNLQDLDGGAGTQLAVVCPPRKRPSPQKGIGAHECHVPAVGDGDVEDGW